MRSIPITLRYILLVYFTGLLFFTLFRCLLIFTNIHQLAPVPAVWSVMGQSMFMGLRFDTVVSGYLLVLPFTILVVAELCGRLGKRILFPIHILLCVLYAVCFFICAADIPFYINYHNRLNVTLLNWTSSPMFMVRLVWEDNTFLAYFTLFLFAAAVFIFLMTGLYKRYKGQATMRPVKGASRRYFAKTLFSILFLGCMLLAIRGRTDEKTPIVPGTAYFCNYSLPNQAGLNPVFTFMWSWTDAWKPENKKLELISDNEAISNGQGYLHVANKDHSISRPVTANGNEHKYNVVIVLMESMSAYYLQHYGNTQRLTPNLDTLAQNGISFSNFYSAGIHTFNGIFSVLYGYPALMARHTMEGTIIPSYTGLPYFFLQRGYETMYFTTHDDQFDNVGGFLSANYVHTIISKKDYPANKSRSTLGVSDHDMFDLSLPVLRQQYDAHKPFFAVYMTASNHNPYIIPPGIPFSPKHTEVRGGCVEYADWAIGHYMKEVSAMPWYDSTIFVFLGDHGSYEGTGSYGDLPLSYSHIPCIIYAPAFRNKPAEIHMPGGQTDLLPTIAGLVGGDYTNNTMGIDLLHDSRRWAFFSQDDKIGVADTGDLYIWQKNGPEYMFSIAGRKDILQSKRAKADSMRTYAFSMIQFAQWLRNNNKTGPNAK